MVEQPCPKYLLAKAVVEGGMKPKLESCVDAISKGVKDPSSITTISIM